jgi:type VI secretion system secreted protein Hcp
MAIFVTIPDIPGESVQKDHEDAIDAFSFQWGVSNAGSAVDKKVQPPSFSDLTITKALDRSTTRLALACATGERLRSVRLDETASYTDGGLVTVLTIQLWDAVVTAVSEAGAGDDGAPSDAIAFDFPKVEVVYTLFDSKGKKKGTERFGWDVSRNASF